MPASPIRWKKQEIEWLWCTILAWLHLTDVPEQHEDGCMVISNPDSLYTYSLIPIKGTLFFCSFFSMLHMKAKTRRL